MTTTSGFIPAALAAFRRYKLLGEKTMAILSEAQLGWCANEESNSISMIVQHLHGNMLSRWTDFLTTDGEKPWRRRDAEFEQKAYSKDQLLAIWEEGWLCLFTALDNISDNDLERKVTIRGEPLTVTDAIIRQLTHYGYHVGQIVFAGKILAGNAWQSLSIPKGQSDAYNEAIMQKNK